jgi:hypothetical protein
METLIYVLICIVIFCILAYGLLWVCGKFFPEFPPARWICGAILLIVLLIFAASQFGGGSGVHFPEFRHDSR